jgi:RNA polymerase sigma-70 factor (ECF subfamily)
MEPIQWNELLSGEAARSPESDSALVRQAKQDIRAFAPLYERYRDDVLRYAMHCLGDREDAADATQQVFTNALAALSRFEDTGDSFKKWLFRIAHNEVTSRRRQRARRPEHALHDAEWVVDAGRTPEELAIMTDERALANILVMRLTPEQRRCCALRFSGHSHRETAVLLGKSEVAVRASFSRGLATLRDSVDDYAHGQ